MLKLFILSPGWARALLTRLLTLTQSLFNTTKYNKISWRAFWASRAFCPLGLGVETARALFIVSPSSEPGLLSLSLSWARACSKPVAVVPRHVFNKKSRWLFFPDSALSQVWMSKTCRLTRQEKLRQIEFMRQETAWKCLPSGFEMILWHEFCCKRNLGIRKLKAWVKISFRWPPH